MKKLVRDEIPRIIRESGKVPNYRILSNAEMTYETMRKIHEETKELQQAFDACNKGDMIAELADVHDILAAFMTAMDITEDELYNARVKKFSERGGFNKRIFLNGIK